MKIDEAIPGAQVYVTSYGYGIPTYLVGRRGVVEKPLRTRARVRFLPSDMFLGMREVWDIDFNMLGPSGASLRSRYEREREARRAAE